MVNQQDYVLNSEQIQVILTGTFGDGCIVETKSNKLIKSFYRTNCIYEEYIYYKQKLLGDIANKVASTLNKGYKEALIYSTTSIPLLQILKIHKKSLEEKLKLLTPLGLALWFYDDGSKHKKHDFYNLNTHAFSLSDHENYLKPYFDSMGFNCKILQDKKKDGRIFYYLYFGRHISAFKVAQLLDQYKIPCFEYKRWSSTTIQKWSKLQMQLKSGNTTVSSHMFSRMLKNIVV